MLLAAVPPERDGGGGGAAEAGLPLQLSAYRLEPRLPWSAAPPRHLRLACKYLIKKEYLHGFNFNNFLSPYVLSG